MYFKTFLLLLNRTPFGRVKRPRFYENIYKYIKNQSQRKKLFQKFGQCKQLLLQVTSINCKNNNKNIN